jgi:hypothetical protein
MRDSKITLRNLARSRMKRKRLLAEFERDYEMSLGKQWDPDDEAELDSIGVLAITINKIQPNIFLLSGLQRQNRSNFTAFPEGEEDTISGEIATKLMQNVMKQTSGQDKISEMFEHSAICGEGYLEPYIDYTFDLVNGEMKFRNYSPFWMYPDPDAKEYDFSDGKFFIKITPDLTREQLDELFPDEKSKLDKIQNGKIDFDTLASVSLSPEVGHNDDYDNAEEMNVDEFKEKTFDLIDEYYKKNVKKWFVVNTGTGDRATFDSEDEAKAYGRAQKLEGLVDSDDEIVIVARFIPEIWHAQVIGKETITDDVAWTYPRWRHFPVFPCKAHWIQAEIKDSHLLTQGIARSLRGPQIELNKARTLEMRHLNQIPNSGWLAEEDTFKDIDAVQRVGSSPGVVIEYKKGKPIPQRISPSGLSQGHAQIVIENKQDIKEISGINAELLSANESSASGRAIRLRQQQGLVNVQRIMDNLAKTSKIIGNFILSMLGEVYTVKTAMRVLGEAFIQENFGRKQVINDQSTGFQEAEVDVIDERAAREAVAKVLNDTSLGKYDVAIGEAVNSETVKLANFAILRELAESGLPIPPEVLIDESTLSESSKRKINSITSQARENQGA